MFNERDQILKARHARGLAGQDVETGAAMPGIGNTMTVGVPDADDVLAEVKQLIVDLRDAAQDGRDLARRYGDLLQEVVESYCHEFEQRAEAALARLEAVQ